MQFPLGIQWELIMQVFQGVILASRDRFMKNSPLGELPPFGGSVTSPEGYMLGLWVHECQRVFSDKMITLEDKAWVDGAIKDLCKTNFSPELTKQVTLAYTPLCSANMVSCVYCNMFTGILISD